MHRENLSSRKELHLLEGHIDPQKAEQLPRAVVSGMPMTEEVHKVVEALFDGARVAV